jgi:hypothetical protein
MSVVKGRPLVRGGICAIPWAVTTIPDKGGSSSGDNIAPPTSSEPDGDMKEALSETVCWHTAADSGSGL